MAVQRSQTRRNARPILRFPRLFAAFAAVWLSAIPSANAGISHYPWCETVRDRCFAKAEVRKAECNWRYHYAKTHLVDGLSKWPKGVANYCYLYPGGATTPTVAPQAAD